jgi:hypothetical protein
MRFNQEKREMPPGGALRRQSLRGGDGNEAEAVVVFSLIVPSAALETGDVALHGAHSGEGGAAFATGIKISGLETNALQWKVMASRFVGNAEILAGLAPFDSMRRDLPAAGALLRKKVGKLMAQRALDLRGRDFNELRIERDRFGPPASETRRCSQLWIPFHGYPQLGATCRPQKLAAKFFEEHIPPVVDLFAELRAGDRHLGEKAQVAKNRSSKVEHDESLFHQAAMS